MRILSLLTDASFSGHFIIFISSRVSSSWLLILLNLFSSVSFLSVFWNFCFQTHLLWEIFTPISLSLSALTVCSCLTSLSFCTIPWVLLVLNWVLLLVAQSSCTGDTNEPVGLVSLPLRCSTLSVPELWAAFFGSWGLDLSLGSGSTLAQVSSLR